MTIILSAFGDKLRSMPIEVPALTGRYYKMMVMSHETPWTLGTTVCAKELTFVDRGKREYMPGYRFDHVGVIHVYELEVPA